MKMDLTFSGSDFVVFSVIEGTSRNVEELSFKLVKFALRIEGNK